MTINQEIPVDVGQHLYSYKNGLVIDTIYKITFNYIKRNEPCTTNGYKEMQEIRIILQDSKELKLTDIGTFYFTSREELLKHIVGIIV